MGGSKHGGEVSLHIPTRIREFVGEVVREDDGDVLETVGESTGADSRKNVDIIEDIVVYYEPQVLEKPQVDGILVRVRRGAVLVTERYERVQHTEL